MVAVSDGGTGTERAPEPRAAQAYVEPICVVTRVRPHRRTMLPRIVWLFFRFKRLARRIPGYVDSVLVLRTGAVMFVSVWETQSALIRFTTHGEHTDAVRWTRTRADIWSGIFRLSGTSSLSRPWIGPIRHWTPVVPPDQEVDGPPHELH